MLECGAGQLRYAEAGDGPPLVLLPKLGGWIAEWNDAAAGLASRYRTIAIDPPGHGGSQMRGDPPYIQSLTETAAAIIAALDTIGVETFSVAGASIGGCTAIVLAALWPARVARLALLSTSLAGQMSRAELQRSDAAVMPGAFTPEGRPLPRTAADFAKFGPMRAAVIADQNDSRAAAGLWLRPCERGAGRLGISSYLPRIEAPTLVMNAAAGHYVQYIPVAERLIRDVRFITVPESGVFMHQEQPEVTAAHLRDFFGA
jgi:pimeloyl-ACP methyl ester carboxylesterase